MKDTTKLFIVCCVFSFIVGAFVAVTIQKDRGCTVTYRHGNMTHVMVGSR